MPLVQGLLREQGVGLAVSEVSGGRANKLGNLVAVLELSAIYLDAGFGIAEEGLGHGLNHAGLAGAGWAEKEQVSNRATGRIQPGQKHLIDLCDFLDRRVLTYNLAPQRGVEILCVIAAPGGIQRGIQPRPHTCAPSCPGRLSSVFSMGETKCRVAINQKCFWMMALL